MFTSLLSIPLLASLLSITTQSHQVTAAPASTWNQTLEARQGVNTGFAYGSEKVRGVNLGGWLLLGKLSILLLLLLLFPSTTRKLN
jgi:hypothetical protein